MTVQHLNDLKKPIGEILQMMGPEGALLESPAQTRYALIPLDDDLIDYLIERNPKFIVECSQIRENMRAGGFHSHDSVKKLLGQ